MLFYSLDVDLELHQCKAWCESENCLQLSSLCKETLILTLSFGIVWLLMEPRKIGLFWVTRRFKGFTFHSFVNYILMLNVHRFYPFPLTGQDLKTDCKSNRATFPYTFSLP